MFGNLGVHIIKFPSGRYGFVGTIPAVLGEAVSATTSDIRGGRAFTTPEGEMVIKFPAFGTLAEAFAHAEHHGVTARSNEK